MILGLVGRRAMRDMAWDSVHRIVLEMAATVHTPRGEGRTLLRRFSRLQASYRTGSVMINAVDAEHEERNHIILCP